MWKPLAAGALSIVALAAPAHAQTGLTESTRLAAVYDTVLQAKFDDARSQLGRTCPPAPAEACQSLSAGALWWEIQIDPDNRRLDAQFEAAAQAAIAAAERWSTREPRRAEPWFYLAASHGALAQWQVLRGQRLSAARGGKTIKDSLERAIALDPGLQDAYFGIGLYHYVADVAPAALKLLRWILLMPGGNRAQGLQEMLRAREQGALLKWEADYQLHWLYVWYEHQPSRAIELLQGLDARFKSNPLFLQRIAEVQRDSIHDRTASMAAWQLLFERARTRQVEFASIAEVRARLGLAEQFVALSQPSRAIDLLTPMVETHPTAPYGAEALVQLALGRAYERLGDRDRARIAFQAAIARAPSDDPDHIRSRSREAIARMRTNRHE